MTDSEKMIKYNELLNDFLSYKEQLQPKVVPQPPVNIPNIPKSRQEMQQRVTPKLVRKRASLLTPPATIDPTNIPLPSSSASEDEQSTKKKKKWHSFSDDEEEDDDEERRIHNLTRHLQKRLRDDKEYQKFSPKNL